MANEDGGAINVSVSYRLELFFFSASPNPKTAVNFAISSTKDPLEQLRNKHNIGPNGPTNTAEPPKHQQNARHQVHFQLPHKIVQTSTTSTTSRPQLVTNSRGILLKEMKNMLPTGLRYLL
jgi:transcription initiation factor TFIID subunit TAF12